MGEIGKKIKIFEKFFIFDKITNFFNSTKNKLFPVSIRVMMMSLPVNLTQNRDFRSILTQKSVF